MSPVRRRHLILLTLTAAAGVAVPSAAQIIDDFEAGSFAFGPDSLDYMPVGPGHAVSPARGVTTYGQTWATLASGLGDDGVVMNGPEGWQANFEWRPPQPVDLTHGDAYDRFIVRMTASDSVSVQVCVEEGPVICASWSGTITIGNADPEFLFADMIQSDLVDFHQITAVRFWFTDVAAGGLGSYATVWSIDVGRSAYGLASVDVINQQFCWCTGCPPELSVIDVSFGSARGDHQKYARIGAIVPANPAFKVMVDSFDDGGAVGSWGQSLGNAVYWQNTPYSTSAFEFVTELVQTGVKVPTLASAPVLTVVDAKTIALQYVVRVDDSNSGALLGSSVETVLWDVFPGQGLEFKAVSVTPIEPALRGGVTGGANLGFTLETDGSVDTALPLMTSQTTADWAPGIAPTAAATLERGRLAGLTAAPSVTAAGTRFVLAEPRTHSGSLSVFDVTGRIVRRLSFAAGASAVSWDGCNDSGAALPAGVYFAALPEAGGPLATRVTLVR
ncbi:MAG: FlgD immunoglobulin-like domain containing protein [Candidatus Eiseniibacteriota bacterium]